MSSYYPHRPTHATSADELAQRMQAGAFRSPATQQQPPLALGWDQGSQQQPQSFSEQPAQPAVMAQTTGLHWPQFVNNHRLIGALVAGFAATQLATMFGFWAYGLGLPKLDFATYNGVILERAADIHATPHQEWISGMIFHYANGMVFALGYALVIFPWLGKTRTTRSNVTRSLGMGLFLATASCGWWVPALHQEFHPGFFSTGLGVGTIIGIYVWHIIWSLALGFFFNPQD